ncbi:bifunctional helix-turn-helix transcriptional regulator/GNAT family N-acetyltransferase [Collimonas silvisoli]|uniref:bifunctional helix-turn-helix transcriptional regulator/GNAT family N-acetyltransferase n=1 Tax=Collimonas silvisoli TaxID=2825884 RepID=UPI001B8B01B7|nr:helix-turn-helix domain-containing GNAT family N-acetyltransferase [Collimonas silvisoli]
MDYFNFWFRPKEHTILALREFSRKLVRELGFMRQSLADSDLAPSAVHAIIEIGLAPGIQARNLASVLRLDKSNTSRQVAKLEALGLLTRESVDDDGRCFRLYLTDAGKKLRKKIDRFATDQVSSALRQLAPADQQALVRSLALYTDALARNNAGKAPRQDRTIDEQIQLGYQPGCIGDIASLHARFYSQMSGFGIFFERKVATELAEFAQALPSRNKALWLYVENGRTLASIAIDGDEVANSAHLRWFIVDDSLRGSGVGRRLLSLALDFADARFDQTYLWTLKGLDAARHLYQSSGFELTDEAEGSQWGKTVVEQRFSRQSSQSRH